jgi:hypothetical protein
VVTGLGRSPEALLAAVESAETQVEAALAAEAPAGEGPRGLS